MPMSFDLETSPNIMLKVINIMTVGRNISQGTGEALVCVKCLYWVKIMIFIYAVVLDHGLVCWRQNKEVSNNSLSIKEDFFHV